MYKKEQKNLFMQHKMGEGSLQLFVGPIGHAYTEDDMIKVWQN